MNAGGFSYNNWTANVADDNYHRWREDIRLMQSLNVTSYRFSVAWARIIHANESVNTLGVQHYSQLIDALIEAGIEPVVTAYHWDLPEMYRLHPQTGAPAGFLNSTFFVEKFLHYTRILFTHYGSRVKYWATFNEPSQLGRPHSPLRLLPAFTL